MENKKMIRRNTSWQNVNKWYSNKVGDKGHYYQSNIIFPRVIELIEFKDNLSILDLGCGDGVLARNLDGYNYQKYLGIDLSKDLINHAIKKNVDDRNKFEVLDVSRKLPFDNKFDVITIILAIQNIDNLNGVVSNIQKHLNKDGTIIIVINHPCFRIPKSSSWEVDTKNMHQYRRIYRYLTNHKIRIDMTPGEPSKKEFTYSFHRSLQEYSLTFSHHDLYIDKLYEWSSDKESIGKNSNFENFARDEIPMFMCLVVKSK